MYFAAFHFAAFTRAGYIVICRPMQIIHPVLRPSELYTFVALCARRVGRWILWCTCAYQLNFDLCPAYGATTSR